MAERGEQLPAARPCGEELTQQPANGRFVKLESDATLGWKLKAAQFVLLEW
jgi:hypothetical protein